MARKMMMAAVVSMTAAFALTSTAAAQGSFGGMPTMTPQAKKELERDRARDEAARKKKEEKRPAYVVVDQGGPNSNLGSKPDPDRARFSTIKEALNEVAWGGVVVVMPGVYRESIELERSVSLQGDRGNGAGVIIQPPTDSGSCLTFKPKNFNEHARVSNIEFLPASSSSAPCVDVENGIFTLVNSVVDGRNMFNGELVSIRGGTAILEKNRFSGGRVGVHVDQQHSLWDSAMLIDNIVAENGEAGIHLAGVSSMLATGNLINTNGIGINYDGIGEATVVGNKILNNGNHGMILGENGKEVLVRLNQIWSNGQDGILVKNSAGLIEDNDIDGNGGVEISTIGHLSTVPTIVNDVAQNVKSPVYTRNNRHNGDQTTWRVGAGPRPQNVNERR